MGTYSEGDVISVSLEGSAIVMMHQDTQISRVDVSSESFRTSNPLLTAPPEESTEAILGPRCPERAPTRLCWTCGAHVRYCLCGGGHTQ
eukprot:5344335-Prymnesium_polylepis.2